MNRLSPTPVSRRRIRPRTTVLGGTALGLIAGAAAYVMISSGSATASIPVPSKPALVSAASAPSPAAAAPCARGQKLDHGVCIVHVQRTVVVAAPPSGANLSSASRPGGDPSPTGEHATEDTDRQGAEHSRQDAEHAENAGHAEDAEHAEETEHAEDARDAEHAQDAAEHATDSARESEDD